MGGNLTSHWRPIFRGQPILTRSQLEIQTRREDGEKLQEIYQCILSRDYTKIAEILRRGIYLDQVVYIPTFSLQPTPFGARAHMTPVFVLHAAATFHLYDIVNLLLRHGASPNLKDVTGQTALHMGISIRSSGNPDGSFDHHWEQTRKTVEALCAYGADVNARDVILRTPLHKAAKSGSAEMVTILINRGAEVDMKDCDGVTPLMLAAEVGTVKAMKVLMKHGADVFATSRDNMTMLHYCAMHTHTIIGYKSKLPTFSMLVTEFPKLNVNACDVVSRTPLHIAAHFRDHSAVRYLLRRGADPSIQASNGRTALFDFLDTVFHRLYRVQNSETLIAFLDDMVSPGRLIDNNGQTPTCFHRDSYHNNTKFTETIKEILMPEHRTPQPLAFLCRAKIKRQLGINKHRTGVYDLPLPESLKKYLMCPTANRLVCEVLEISVPELKAKYPDLFKV
ncbi:ankyrin repeat domain-containing protein 61-like [Glandiceps talaboti]